MVLLGIFIIVLTTIILCRQVYDQMITIHQKHPILIGVILVDPGLKTFTKVYDKLKRYLKEDNIKLVILTRKNDVKVIEKYSTIANYLITIDECDLNDLGTLSTARNIIRKFALNGNYEFLWFIDSDIVVGPYLNFLLLGIVNYEFDVITCPYKLPWLGYPAVGQLTGPIRVKHNYNGINYKTANFVGMGCTLLSRKCLYVEFKVFKVKHQGLKNSIEGEDVGFCWQCYRKNYKIGYIDKLALRLN